MRRRRADLLTLLLLAGLVAVPILLTWREVRQERLNQALIAAVDRNDVGTARRLLRQGVDPNAQALPDDQRPLWRRFWDVLKNRREQRLLNGETALIRAIAFGSVLSGPSPPPFCDNADTVQALVEAGAEVNDLMNKIVTAGFDAEGDPLHVELKTTPLILAIRCGKHNVMQVLLAHHADANMADESGIPPLMRAAYDEDARSVEALLQHGANIRATDSEGATVMLAALDMHLHNPHPIADIRQTVAVLMRYRAPMQQPDTLLRLARDYWHDPQLIQLLKQAGAKEEGKRP